MKKLLFVFLGFFILSAFNMFNEEELKELNSLRNEIEEIKQDQEDIEEDLYFVAAEGDREEQYRQLVEKLRENKVYRGLPDDYDGMSYGTVQRIMKEIRDLGYEIPTDLFFKYRDYGELQYATKNNEKIANRVIGMDNHPHEPFSTILLQGLSCRVIPEAVETFLKQGISPNQPNAKGETPLIALFRYNYNGKEQTTFACVRTNTVVKIIEILLKYNANINARDNRGCTVLGYATAAPNCPRADDRYLPKDTKPFPSPSYIIDLLKVNGASY